MLTDTIEEKALALIAEVRAEQGMPAPDYLTMRAALIRAIEQHEAFRQEVSDVISELSSEYTSMGSYYADKLKRFIIAKPDPLVEALNDMEDGRAGPTMESYAACLRAALAARGLEIREKQP